LSSETLTGVRIAADDEQVLALRSIPLERTVTDIHAPGIGLDQATPAPVLSGTTLGVVIRTAIRQATQSVMKYIARKTTKLVYPPH
jgi:hypothetical protein